MRLDTKVVKEYFTASPPNEKHPFPQSPTLAVPKQIRRTLPAVLGFLFLCFFFSGSVGGPESRFWPSSGHAFFPKKIWQTWKVDPLGFEERDSKVAKSWIQKNPEYRYEVLTDQNDMAYVEQHFGPEELNRPDIIYIYRQLTTRIIKADLLRYMIMYVEGGVYTDIDVEALRPINKFIPERWNEKDVSMIVGVEIDQPEFKNHTILGQKCMSFVQWTFVCKPRLPVMMTLIEYIMNWLKEIAHEQGVPIADIKLDFDQVIVGTGPTAFTRAIMNDMSKRTGRDVTWDEFHNMYESKLIGGTLVLTVEAFAAGQGHSDSGSHDGKHSLIRHHYHASKWPTTHPRVKHPVYNEVEQCNWDRECVEKWDRDVAEFETFDQEEKDRRIAEKEEKDREREEEDRRREEEERVKKEQEDAERFAREERERMEREGAEAERHAADEARQQQSDKSSDRQSGQQSQEGYDQQLLQEQFEQYYSQQSGEDSSNEQYDQYYSQQQPGEYEYYSQQQPSGEHYASEQHSPSGEHYASEKHSSGEHYASEQQQQQSGATYGHQQEQLHEGEYSAGPGAPPKPPTGADGDVPQPPYGEYGNPAAAQGYPPPPSS